MIFRIYKADSEKNIQEDVVIMIRIGIIGSDSSHALAFSKLTNIKDNKTSEYNFPDVRVTGIFGLEKEKTKRVAEEGQIEFVADKPEDLAAKVDAVMVVFRHGDLHAPYALPFIKIGMPVWIDKPFTIKVPDAKQLIKEAKKSKCLLTGGSTCKYAYDILMLRNVVENPEKIDGIQAGAFNFPADLDSEYGGLFFYGGHLAEMMLTVFGYDVKSVSAYECNGNVVAVAKYDNYYVTLNFLKKTSEHKGIVYGGSKTVIRDLDRSIVYCLGFAKFVEMLQTGKMPMSFQQLITPILLMNAITESLKTRKEVNIVDFAGDSDVFEAT